MILEKIEKYELTKDDLTSEKLYNELFAITDLFQRGRYNAKILEQAKMFGMKAQISEIIKARSKAERKAEKDAEVAQEEQAKAELTKYIANANGGQTSFLPDANEKQYPQMFCAGWVADEDGIKTAIRNQLVTICHHPIIPVKRLRNLETGLEQVVIAYKRNNYWQEITVPRKKIASAKNIVDLADNGVGVTSENARDLVRFLSDVEAFNENYIKVDKSTSKLGWRDDNVFSPYDKSIVFDGEYRFGDLYNSVRDSGDYYEWMILAKQLRSSGKLEPRVALAASFASALVSRIGSLPFIVDFYGQTGGGKTVTLMLAASVWAEPAARAFIGDFRMTDTAIEARSDMLNNLPMILDDTKNASIRLQQNYESLIYNLCAGKGKTRSNKDLGIQHENTWANTTICSGEGPISEFATGGGAINRIIEVKCSEEIYDNPAATAEIVGKNYGHAGKIFVAKLKEIGSEKLKEMYRDIQNKFIDSDIMQKQAMAISVLLLADQIATETIFLDDCQLQIEDVKDLIATRNQVSEGLRAYLYLRDVVDSERQHFDPEKENITQWGFPPIKGADRVEWMTFYPSQFERILKDGNYSKSAFTAWADHRGLIKKNAKSGFRVSTRFGEMTAKMINIKVLDNIEDMTDQEIIKKKTENSDKFQKASGFTPFS